MTLREMLFRYTCDLAGEGRWGSGGGGGGCCGLMAWMAGPAILCSDTCDLGWGRGVRGRGAVVCQRLMAWMAGPAILCSDTARDAVSVHI